MLMIRYFDFNYYLLYLSILDKVKLLKLGDVFWYKIYKYKGIIFSEGHRIRPFVFLKYDNEYIYCLLCSTTRLEGLQLINDNDKYNYVNYKILVKIPIYGFISVKGKLYINQIKKLARIIYFNSKFNEVNELLKDYVKIEIGDFVLYNDKEYILYGMDSYNVTLYPISTTKVDFKTKISNKCYVDIVNYVITKKENIKLILNGNIQYIELIKDQKRKNRKVINEYRRIKHD